MGVLPAMISGGERRPRDYYPTPPEATLALLPLLKKWPRKIWEPACGDGSIAEVLEANGYIVTASDVVTRYGANIDFLALDAKPFSIDAVVTNPPWGKLIDDFIYKIHAFRIRYAAVLMKMTFWNAANRRQLWNKRPPALLAPLTWRLDFTGQGAPHTDCMWCVWEPQWPALPRNDTTIRFLEKPHDDRSC